MEHVESAEYANAVQVRGFPLLLDRWYDPQNHMWVQRVGPGEALRIGLDPLGVETSGTLAQLSFEAAGHELVQGRPFGQLEAAKFVGPLISPVSGTLLSGNDAVVQDPGLAERDPFGDGWLIEVSPGGAVDGLPGLITAPDEIIEWFGGKVDDYRLKGVIAE